MKFGIGKWREIEDSGLLPGKMNQQLYGQTQRLLGQQSIVGASAGLHKAAHPRAVRLPADAACGLCL